MEALIKHALNRGPVTSEKPAETEGPNILVFGIGGAGNNTLSRLANVGVVGAQLVAVNTDKQHLETVPDNVKKILIGEKITRGLGAGGHPPVGRRAAELERATLSGLMDRADLVFIAAGMGGGTGTGAAPVFAELAKNAGAIVVSIVTYPFELERNRLEKAAGGIAELRKHSNTVIVVDNNRLMKLVPSLPIEQAFMVADEIITKAVKGITEIITVPSLVNIDFADIKAIMGKTGHLSIISVGDGTGSQKVNEALNAVLNNRLLDVDYRGATGALVHITGGPDLTLAEANTIGEELTGYLSDNANVIWGARIKSDMEEKLEVIAIMTGITEGNFGAAGVHKEIAEQSVEEEEEERDDFGIKIV